jgi:hypothetical protein
MSDVAVVYTSGYRLTDGERECIRSLENAGRRVLVKNGQFFERVAPATAVYSDLRHVRRAAQARGMGAFSIGEASGKMTGRGTPLEEDTPERIVTHEVKGAWAYVYVDGEKVETVRKAQIREALARWERT